MTRRSVAAAAAVVGALALLAGLALLADARATPYDASRGAWTVPKPKPEKKILPGPGPSKLTIVCYLDGPVRSCAIV